MSSFRGLQLARALAGKAHTGAGEPMNEIVPGLFLGAWEAAHDPDALRAAAITHVLTVMDTRLFKLDAAALAGFATLQLPVIDTPAFKLLPYFPQCIDLIDRALRDGGKVLVHCFLGVSRSASVVVAYLMAKRALAPRDALALVRVARPIAQPNVGFMRQLETFHAAQCVVVPEPPVSATAEVVVVEHVPPQGSGRVRALAAAYKLNGAPRPSPAAAASPVL